MTIHNLDDFRHQTNNVGYTIVIVENYHPLLIGPVHFYRISSGYNPNEMSHQILTLTFSFFVSQRDSIIHIGKNPFGKFRLYLIFSSCCGKSSIGETLSGFLPVKCSSNDEK
jgi:hypothetical protein